MPVVGPLADLSARGYRKAIIAIGDNTLREKLAGSIKNVEWVSVVHPHAYLHPSVQLGEGTVVFAGAVVQPDASIGAHVIVNTGATIDHDCLIL